MTRKKVSELILSVIRYLGYRKCLTINILT